MARRNYLVEGLSGTGKSSVYEALIRRGYLAVSTDRAWKVVASSSPLALWDQARAVAELERPEPEVLFVCGSGGNRDRFLPYFAGIFNLRIDDDTMRRRLRERTNNDFGKEPDELALMLGLNRSGERTTGAIDVDATRPRDPVVAELLRRAGGPAVASDSATTLWSRREEESVRSFVIPASALPLAEPAAAGSADALRDILRRAAVVELEYAWSGRVLSAVLSYLGEQGIDLGRDDAQTREASILVLASDQRERHEARLDPSAFDGVALRRHYEQVEDTAATGVEYALLDGIAFLRDTLATLDSASVAVLVVDGSA